MIDELNKAIEDYTNKWRKLVAGRGDKAFFETLKPTALGWKVADRAEYTKLCAGLHDQTDMIVEKWMNGRWIAKLHLRNTNLNCGIEIIKVMERRPGSTDALGLDHLDFYSPEVSRAEEIIQKELGLKWSWETNDAHSDYKWISLWFDNTEAKLKADTVIDIIKEELEEINEHIKTKAIDKPR